MISSCKVAEVKSQPHTLIRIATYIDNVVSYIATYIIKLIYWNHNLYATIMQVAKASCSMYSASGDFREPYIS